MLPKDLVLRMYDTIVKIGAMDHVFYEAQRQGRISFYMTCEGEEAAVVGSAAALEEDDEIYSQYRESASLMYRGFSVQEMADQVNLLDGKTTTTWIG
jgi:2-oxoisovalerate dehydrogenase E1 component alpha subunit